MFIIKKYAASVNSCCLTDDEHHHQTDALAAVALSSKLGSLLYRAKWCGDQFSVLPLLEIWRGMVLHRAKRGNWPDVAEEVADISLWYWLENTCNTCKGRGHPIVPDTPNLQAIQCECCSGTGRKKLQCHAEIKDHVLDSVQVLEQMARDAGRMAAKKLA